MRGSGRIWFAETTAGTQSRNSAASMYKLWSPARKLVLTTLPLSERAWGWRVDIWSVVGVRRVARPKARRPLDRGTKKTVQGICVRTGGASRCRVGQAAARSVLTRQGMGRDGG